MRNCSPPSSKDNSAPRTIQRHEDDVKGGLRGGESLNGSVVPAAPEAQTDDSDGIDWIARHSAYMDLRVRAKLRKSYEEVNEEEDGLGNTSGGDADADSDWSERRASKRVTKKRECYSPAESFQAGEPKHKVAKTAPPGSAKRTGTKRRKPATSTYVNRRRPTGFRPRGIDNPDLTCYVNSVLQSFFCNDSVKEYLLNLPEGDDLFQALNGDMSSVLIVHEFRKVMRALSGSEERNGGTVPRLVSSISASAMMTEVRKIMPEFLSSKSYKNAIMETFRGETVSEGIKSLFYG
uniref:USP domain-containing protein n=1 Tax=Steinernema glaseri TaxID=37863 RepID=A0A1I7YT65_9BILA